MAADFDKLLKPYATPTGCDECGHPWAFHMHPSAKGRCVYVVGTDEYCGCEARKDA